MAEPAHSPTRPGRFRPGDLLDNYKIIRLIGRGGMGEVYLARDTQLGRRAALKLITPEALGKGDHAERFIREARVTARFNHPHIVTVYAVGHYEQHPYVALEYIEGQTLRDRLDEERPGLREALRYGLAIAEALAEAHSHGVMHRDLKPQNVVVPLDGRLRVLDFGLAKQLHTPDLDVADRTAIPAGELPLDETIRDVFETTDRHAIRGTPAYMSPEQWEDRTVTPAADMWALGLILFELVTGRYPMKQLNFLGMYRQVCGPEPLPAVAEVEPDLPDELQELIDSCLNKDDAERPTAARAVHVLQRLVDGGRRTTLEAERPFRGLLPFTERHADRFYGRDGEIAAFVERLREQPILPVVGASGAGKSSFVQAGVIPRLREQGAWQVIRMRPGPQPFETLAARLIGRSTTRSGESGLAVTLRADSAPTGPRPEVSHPELKEASLIAELTASPERLALVLAQRAETDGCRILLFVDQLEELYTLTEDPEVRRGFMRALCTAADDPEGPVRAIFTLRDDFLGRLAEGAEARQVLGQITVLRTPGTDALAEILHRPVQQAGYAFEDEALVDEMIAAVGAEPAALPLLQFAGQLLWERRDRDAKLLTRRAYTELGGVTGALAQHADSIIAGFSPAEVQIARAIFVRLVSTEGTRRVVPRSQLLEGLGKGAGDLLERLTSARALLVRKGRDEPELELVHESLIDGWVTLRRWLEESRDERTFLAEIDQAAELWDKRGRPQEEVWRGAALIEAVRRAARCAVVPERVQRFLDAGERAQARRRRRGRLLWGGGLFASVVVALAAIAVSVTLRSKEQEASRQRRLAERERRTAERQKARAIRQRAEANREGARAALGRGEVDEARAKVRRALETYDSPLARAIWWRLRRHPLVWKRRLGSAIYALVFSPDGRTIAVANQYRTIYLADVATAAIRVLRGHGDQVFTVAFSPDGQRLVSGTWDGELWVWDLRSGEVRHKLTPRGAALYRVDFNPRGDLLATARTDGKIRLWRTDTWKVVRTLEGHKGVVASVDFSPDGRSLLSAGYDGTLRIWSMPDGGIRQVLRGHEGAISDADYSADGKRILSGARDRTLRLWDAASGKMLRVMRGSAGRVNNVAIHPSGRTAISSGMDVKLRFWDLETGKMLRVVQAHQTLVWSIDYDPTGRYVATGGVDRDLKLWRAAAAREQHTRPPPHRSSVHGVRFSPDDRELVSGGTRGRSCLWDVRTGEIKQTSDITPARTMDLLYVDDKTLLMADNTGKIRFWDSGLRRQHAVMSDAQTVINHMELHRDGRTLITTGYDHKVRVWDVTTRKLRRTFSRHRGAVKAIALHPNGKHIASAGADRIVRIWEIATGRELRTLRGHTDAVSGLSFHPGGRWLASGSHDQTARLWDLERGTSQVLLRAKGRVYWLSFDPSGRWLGIPAADGVVRLWDRETGKMRELRGHASEVNFARFDSTGRVMATTSDDATVRLWRIPSGHPAWRAPLLRRKPLELATHLGWRQLGNRRRPAPARSAPRAWRRRVLEDARHADESSTGLLCLATTDGVERWDTDADRRQSRESLRRVDRVVALGDACWSLAEGVLRRHGPRGRTTVVRRQVTAIATIPETNEMLVAATRRVYAYGRAGDERRSYPGDAGMTAVGWVYLRPRGAARPEPRLVLGFRDGSLELRHPRPGQRGRRFTFSAVPSSPVVRIIAGPTGVVVAGYANGSLGMWSLANGKRLQRGQLYGPVIHLLRQGRQLVAASELGHYLTLDLGAFHVPYCELMREVWKAAPVVWENGLPVVRPPPPGHACRAR